MALKTSERLFPFLACYFIFLFLLFGSALGQSEKAMEHYQNGNYYLDAKQYQSALEYFGKAIDESPDYGNAIYSYALTEYFYKYGEYGFEEWKRTAERIDRSKKLMKKSSIPDAFDFISGNIYFNAGRYSEAKEALEAYLPKAKSKPHIEAHIQSLLASCRFARDAIKTPIEFSPQNLGPEINSWGGEYLPMLTADGNTLFFTARNEHSMGEFSKNIDGYPEDFFYSEKVNGKWQKAKNLGPPVNTVQNEGAASFSQDGQFVIFALCDREEGYGSCDLGISRLKGKEWEVPALYESPLNTSSWDSQPCISHDGKTLWFSSTRPGGYGRADIWYCTRENDNWSAPVNAGPTINTTGSENSPFLHADGKTLYFSSDGHPGFGSFDLFLSRKVENNWSAPKNLGYPLNTPANEKNIFVEANGVKGWVSLERSDGQGKHDIYYFDLDPSIRPEIPAGYVRGTVRSKMDNQPVPATVTFRNLDSGETIREVETNFETGKFLLSLPPGEDYAAFVDAEGFLFHSQNFSLKDTKTATNFELPILLEPVQPGASLILNNIFFETAKYDLKKESRSELEHLAKFMQNHPRVAIEVSGHTDDVGNDRDNQVLSEQRANEVKKYLVKSGINSDRIATIGYGEQKPLVPNDSDHNRSINRRTEMRITKAP